MKNPAWFLVSVLSVIYAIGFVLVANGTLPTKLLFGFCVWGSYSGDGKEHHEEYPDEDNGCTNFGVNSHIVAFTIDVITTLLPGLFYVKDKNADTNTLMYIAVAFIILGHGLLHWYLQQDTLSEDNIINCYTEVEKEQVELDAAAMCISKKKSTTTSKSNNNRTSAEDAELQEAVYLSELEAATAASMQEKEEKDSSYLSSVKGSTAEAVGSTTTTNTAASTSDYDLQRALYLSGLEIKTQNSNNNRTSAEDAELQQALYLSELEAATAASMQEKEETYSSYLCTVKDVHGVVVKGVPVTAAAAAATPTSSLLPPGAARRRRSSMVVSLETLKRFYHEDFDVLRDSGRVTVTQVPTYQGRIPDSTNGCAVIASLICIHHFHNNDDDQDVVVVVVDANNGRSIRSNKKNINQNDDGGRGGRRRSPATDDQPCILSDQIIVRVIDEETPRILPIIRRNLGLDRNAFLIPHDAHEALTEQLQFITVCGGNILEESHIDALLEELSKVRPNDKKLAATFFFHEHVIAILQLRRSPSSSSSSSSDNNNNNMIWFDIIDSLPHKATLKREKNSTASMTNQNGYEQVTGWPRGNRWGGGECVVDNDNENNPSPTNAVRIRCFDTVALKATLQWYACSVFTSENANYIDTYQWDEKLTDHDPRVFEAFLWTEA